MIEIVLDCRMGSLFATVSALVPTGAGRFDAEVSPDWTIAAKPNGGYLLAMRGRAATETGSHPHVIAASAHYLHSPSPGPITVQAEVLRAGRSASQVRTQLRQDGQLCVEALVTTSTLDAAATPYWDAGLPAPAIAAIDACLRVPAITPIGLPVPIMDQVDLRIDPHDTGFARGEPSGRGELKGWLTLPADETFDPIALLYAIDAFPPATFEIASTGWVPTLELTGYVRALPAPGPVRVLQKAQLIDGQRVDEACFVWDSTGRLVAQGTQLAGIRVG
jgi:acyl-Coa thioesterase superfamily protein/acyl-CoA thioesterase superfamily protein